MTRDTSSELCIILWGIGIRGERLGHGGEGLCSDWGSDWAWGRLQQAFFQSCSWHSARVRKRPVRRRLRRETSRRSINHQGNNQGKSWGSNRVKYLREASAEQWLIPAGPPSLGPW